MTDNLIIHQSVLGKEILEIFDPKSGENFIDATIDGGGHARMILEKIGSEGKLLGIDWDCQMIDRLEKRENLILECGNFANLKSIIEKNSFLNIKGVLFDLGFSSLQIEKSGRGFSFQKDEPLDMRFNPKEGISARDILNKYSERDLSNILWEYGEERYSRRIARAIVEARRRKRIESTFDLVEIIKKAAPRVYLYSRIHPATRTFQALRIAVNRELENISKGLEAAYEVLDKNGKIAVISFHSLEDRIVKNFFRDGSKEEMIKIITKKPIRPSEEEIIKNPRARSAKLRAAIKK
ncbi:MAG: 16S rRNA (cytosine(1402)-N(4))-methyltransferase RsmH [Parcubacteria group bacterium]|nr:16S rRNA (cytosine(1402)-N(4))-methyltransferase RsmH [Parcubacteria group bacterium]